MYVKLKRDSSHTGVRGHKGARVRTGRALETFERLRYHENGLQHARIELADARDEVGKALRLYAFILEVSSLKGEIVPPSEGNKRKERWTCGKIDGVNPPSAQDRVHKVKLDGDIPALEAVFLRPLELPLKSNFFPNIHVNSPAPFIKFCRSSWIQLASMNNVVPPLRLSDAWAPFEFDSNRPVVIVGWSASHQKAKKKTTVVQSSGGILDESVTLKITDSPNGNEQWCCRVTFVYQDEYKGFLT